MKNSLEPQLEKSKEAAVRERKLRGNEKALWGSQKIQYGVRRATVYGRTSVIPNDY